MYNLGSKITDFVKENEKEFFALYETLCKIPAPSGDEWRRAAYCSDWFEKLGLNKTEEADGGDGYYTDCAGNVVCRINCENSNPLAVFVAHTDIVFPDTEPLPYVEKDGIVYCPGSGDNTASLACLLMTAKYLHQNRISSKRGFVIAANSGEEGLGNLRGTRRLMEVYSDRTVAFISFDSTIGGIASSVVGSHRYKVTATTAGGHSFGNFGRRNAIEAIAGIVTEIYKIEMPECPPETKVTYNVGTIEGGTTVNTIAGRASMLCEYRSNDAEMLEYMKKKFCAIFDEAASDKVAIDVEVMGERPCAVDVDIKEQTELAELCGEIASRIGKRKATYGMSSTDCNIPLSLGIPAVCTGVSDSRGAHTRGEHTVKASLLPGLEIAIETVLNVGKAI